MSAATPVTLSSGGAERQERPRRRRALCQPRETDGTEHHGGTYRRLGRSDERDVYRDDDDRSHHRCAPREPHELEQCIERECDDPDVESGDGEHVRETRRSVAIANLGREGSRVGNEERSRERRVGAEHPVDRCASSHSPPLPPCGTARRDERRMLYDDASARRYERPSNTHDASGWCAAVIDRQGDVQRAVDARPMNQGTWFGRLVNEHVVNRRPARDPGAVRVREMRGGGDERAGDQRRSDGAGDRGAAGCANGCDEDAQRATDAGFGAEAREQTCDVGQERDGDERQRSSGGRSARRAAQRPEVFPGSVSVPFDGS